MHPMRLLRMSVRAPALLFGTLGIFFVRVLVWPSALFSERLDRRLRRGILIFFTKWWAFFLGARVEVQGVPPKPPFFIVANHTSYLDALMLMHETGCIFVVRGDVEHWPIMGFMAKSVYLLFIDRADRRDTVRVNELIKHTLDTGDGLAVFPESRIFRGLDVEPFKSALIQPAIDLDLPVHYASITYKTHEGCPPASRIVGWWRPEGFFYHLCRLLQYPGFTATVHFGGEPIRGDDRKKLARALHKAVRTNFVPLD